MKEGNPFGPFWDELGVDFDFHEKYNYDYLNQNLWLKNLPASKYPVLALKGKIYYYFVFLLIKFIYL